MAPLSGTVPIQKILRKAGKAILKFIPHICIHFEPQLVPFNARKAKNMLALPPATKLSIIASYMQI